MSTHGWHYTRCAGGSGGSSGSGSGALAILGAFAVLVIAIAVRKPAEHAADTTVRVVGEVLMIAGIVLASLAGAAVLAGLGWAGVRVYRWQAGRRRRLAAAVPVYQVTVSQPARPLASPQAAIEAASPWGRHLNDAIQAVQDARDPA